MLTSLMPTSSPVSRWVPASRRTAATSSWTTSQPAAAKHAQGWQGPPVGRRPAVACTHLCRCRRSCPSRSSFPAYTCPAAHHEGRGGSQAGLLAVASPIGGVPCGRSAGVLGPSSPRCGYPCWCAARRPATQLGLSNTAVGQPGVRCVQVCVLAGAPGPIARWLLGRPAGEGATSCPLCCCFSARGRGGALGAPASPVDDDERPGSDRGPTGGQVRKWGLSRSWAVASVPSSCASPAACSEGPRLPLPLSTLLCCSSPRCTSDAAGSQTSELHARLRRRLRSLSRHVRCLY